VNKENETNRTMSLPPEMTAAAAVADSKFPPGDEYEEIREQVSQTAPRFVLKQTLAVRVLILQHVFFS
jgi:hypothetical protein